MRKKRKIALGIGALILALTLAGIIPIVAPPRIDEYMFITHRNMETIQSRLHEFRHLCQRFPTSDEGLELIVKDDTWCEGWNRIPEHQKRIKLYDVRSFRFEYSSNGFSYRLSNQGDPKIFRTDASPPTAITTIPTK